MKLSVNIKELVSRVYLGYDGALQLLKQSVRKTQDTYNKMSGDLEFQIEQVTREFEVFRIHNDLDRLFTSGMDVPRCKKLLDRI